MSGNRFLDYDPETGISRYFHWDDLTETTSIESVQDVVPHLEVNKKLYNHDDYKRHGYKSEMVHIAQIPLIVIEKWLREGIDVYNKDHWPKVRQKLNDPEYMYLRTTSGRL